METAEKRQKNLAEGLIKGVWQLKYKLVNDLGIQGFSGRMIGPYSHPLTGTVQQLILPDNGVQVGYFIGDVITNLYPENSVRDAVIVDWLVGHPEVGIDNNQTKLDSKYLARKISNPRITITNLDHQDMTEIDNEEFIDQLVGRISLDSGKDAIGIEKLRFILAKLDLNYRNAKFISDPSIEKKHLRKSLKTFIRKNISNAKIVEDILSRMDNAKFVYEIKELMRVGLVDIKAGLYFYDNNPIGSSYDAVIDFFRKNPEFYSDITERLYTMLKAGK